MIRATLVLGSSGDQCTETLTVPVGSGPQALTKAIGGLKQATMDVITAQMQKGGGESQVDDGRHFAVFCELLLDNCVYKISETPHELLLCNAMKNALDSNWLICILCR